MGSAESEKQGVSSGSIDPEIADLMGIGVEGDQEEAPDFADLMGEKKAGALEPEQVNLSRKTFAEIDKFEEDPKPYFKDKDYYKIAVSGQGDRSKKVHDLLSRFLKAEDPQDRSMFRSKLVPAYWDLAGGIATAVCSNLPQPKILLLRFGILTPTLITAEQRNVIARIIFDNTTGELVYYVDEWLRKIASGAIPVSSTDETKVVKRNENQAVAIKLNKARGQYDTHYGLITGKGADIVSMEHRLKELVVQVITHQDHPVYKGLKMPYGPDQKAALNEMSDLIRKLGQADKEMQGMFRGLDNAAEQVEEMQEKAREVGASVDVDDEAITKEFNTIRQMTKMCIGRQGNHFPILMKQYFRANIRDIATRENVIREMARVEVLDPGLFERTFKRQTSRIVPYVILLPCYGDRGICWEPFDRFNKATSRGRVAIPMFPKDLRTAVLYTLGDLRWQVAKEKAQHYWMEEGLTGKYYMNFTDRKLKGDVKEFFIQDYILWISKESEGTQKLDREVRGVFWRNMPFPQHIKDNLKNRGFVYNELYKKDSNIARSDGY